jgi:Ni/Fe-hydrogenase subunit HybB-like protein
MGQESFTFLLPNDQHITWSLMIVMYPYITGLVAGAFIVSSLYHVFGNKALQPVARLALVASLAFVAAAPLPLLVHLGHPERSFNVLVTPNFSSAMAAFGFIYTAYALLVVVEIWLVFRRDIIEQARRSRGLRRLFFKILALGVYDTSEEALAIDDKVIRVLAAAGIPLACILHGYVGFIFGSVKANYWWSTPLMPIIFLFSACVSGIAMVTLLYLSLSAFGGRKISGPCVQSLAAWLWLFTLVTVCLELLEIGTLAYERDEAWRVIGPLISSKLAFSFVGVQMVFGAMIPTVLLGILVLLRAYLTDGLRNTLAFLASLILLIQVFAMRWNVVIGGQIFSKSARGFRESYVPDFFGHEGILAALAIFLLPFLIMTLFNRLLPLDEAERPEESPTNGEPAAPETTLPLAVG